MKPPLKILILEDNLDDVNLIERELNRGNISFTSSVVKTRQEFENGLRELKPDVILADHFLPQFNSIDALKLFRAYQTEFNVFVPFILISGELTEEFAVQCIKGGVDDYILKDRLRRLPVAIESALEKCRLEAERLQHFQQVMASQLLMKEAEHLANFGSWEVDLHTGKHTWSDEMFYIYGYDKPGGMEPGFEKFFSHVYADDIVPLKKGFEHALANLDSYAVDFRIMDKKGNLKYISSKQRIIRDHDCPVRLIGFNLDITNRKRADEALNTYFEKVQILEQIGDGFFSVDNRWIVTYWNKIIESHFHLLRENIVGKNLWAVCAGSMPSSFHTQCHKAMDEGMPLHFEEFLPAFDLWLQVSVYPSASGLSVYFKDITVRKKHIAKIEKQNDVLNKLFSLIKHPPD